MHARHMVLAVMLVAIATPALAQQPPQARPGQQAPERRQAMQRQMQPRMQAGPGPEMILRLREQLNLTEAQVNRLEALRQESVNRQRERTAEILDLRSRMQAGQVTREQMQERMRARAEAAPAEGPAPGERVRAVLTDQQRLQLAELQVQQLRRQVQMQGRGRPGIRGGGGREIRPGQRGMVRPGRAPVADSLRERMMERRTMLRRTPPATVTPPGR
jgi:hypothetical protein